MVSNLIERFGKESSALYKNYGVTISGPTGTLKGINMQDLNLTSRAELYTPDSAGKAMDALAGIGDAVMGAILPKFISDPISKKMHENVDATLSKSFKFYKGSGVEQPSFSVNLICVPGMFGFSTYEKLEEFALRATMPKSVAGVDMPYTQHLYSASTVHLGVSTPDLSNELFSLKINNRLTVPGGLYIKDIDRTYSQDCDENGSPIFCTVKVTLQYFRGVFADEYKEWVTIKTSS